MLLYMWVINMSEISSVGTTRIYAYGDYIDVNFKA